MEKRFYQMYGTKDYAISVDGDIMHVPTYDIIVDGAHSNVPATTPLTLRDKNGVITFTPAQFVVYTFYGFTKSEIVLRESTSRASIYNCKPIAFIQQSFDDRIITVEGEIFKKYAENPATKLSRYVSEYGAIIERHFDFQRGFVYEFMQWKFDSAGYPGVPGTSMEPIHVLVYKTFGDPADMENMDIHHKDRCKWNAYIGNLEAIAHGDHSALHLEEALTSPGFSRDRIEMAYKMLSEDAYYANIITAMTGGLMSRRNAAVCKLRDILRNPEAYPDLATKYNVRNFTKHKGMEYDPEAIRKVCTLLAPGEHYSDIEISKMTGISASSVRNIRLGKTNNKMIRDIVENEFGGKLDPSTRKVGQYARVMSDETAKRAAFLCEFSNMTDAEIADECKCAAQLISEIRHGTTKPYRHISNKPIPAHFNAHDRKYKKEILILDPNTLRVAERRPVTASSNYLKRMARRNLI